MSDRDVDFLQGWIHEHLPGELTADKATARTLSTRAALRHCDLDVSEIEEEFGSLEQVIFEALDQHGI
ncbi:DUF768 domain-containing protein [Mesorhizobium neociceri]|uniref:DUF768 domain-containing protein n=1 Tax=Mesorhizobium neociceri TaxID=1307853 RepID=A0A838B090_9HYPH|nr:DUF768 domain-containing protein [Mesorhizobium neociceri]MBA1139503.1 DUF768 domain-containing protein [Mesorhizobium neociceri]